MDQWKVWLHNENMEGQWSRLLGYQSLLVQGIKESKSNTFWSWIRTAEKQWLVMDATVAYGLRLGRSSTSWKAYQVYFPMDPTSHPYLFGVSYNCLFYADMFSAHDDASSYFGPMGRVSSWVHYGRVLGLEHDPSTLLVVLPRSYTL